MTKYSIIIPSRDEALSLPILVSELEKVLRRFSHEIIIINDASQDQTRKVLTNLSKNSKQIKVINFSIQQGKWAALVSGFKTAQGQVVITLDGDLQDDPRELPKLLSKFNQGYDLVSGWRKVRHDPFYKVAISNLGNGLVSALYQKNFHDLNSPFKIYRKEVIEALPKAGTMLRFSLLFAHRQGYRVIEIPVIHRKRQFGQSKFGIVKYIRILYDLVLVRLLFSGSGSLKKTK